MGTAARHRILVVDDEEAILETMAFTFEDDYEVLTATSAAEALDLLARSGSIAAVISDQRMPETTGVEFLTRVFERHPSTVRIILTGFADLDAIIRAINDGHVYAYITKPWEPEQLKQVVHRAVEHHRLVVENERLLRDLRDANVFLEAVMDQLDTGALALDAQGVVRAVNRPAREYLGLEKDPRGRALDEVLESAGLGSLGAAAMRIATDEAVGYEELELSRDGRSVRLRVGVEPLESPEGGELGKVILAREISHEPLRRRFHEIVDGLARAEGALREPLERALADLRELAGRVSDSSVESPGMAEIAERVRRTSTAIDYWLAVDDALAREAFPEAQLLMERMRLAASRWPLADRLPGRVRELARRVESYYESGENPKQRVL